MEWSVLVLGTSSQLGARSKLIRLGSRGEGIASGVPGEKI